MRLRMLIRACRFGQFAGFEINIGVTLRRAINAVGPMQTGIEPLRRVRRAHLVGELIAHFIEESLRIGFGVKIAAFPAPIGPGACQTVKDLGRAGFADVAFFSRHFVKLGSVSGLTPEPGRDVLFLDRFKGNRNTGLAEIFLCQNVTRDL